MLRRKRSRRLLMPSLLACLLIAVAVKPALAAALCFKATGECVGDPFAEYWNGNGGLAVLGYPIAAMAPETNEAGGRAFAVQWLERQRLELHPELPAPYSVSLGRLGVERLNQLGRDWRSLPTAAPATPHYFAVTGHAVAPQFWNYWRTHGIELGDPGVTARESLALFGYPVSKSAMERNAAGDTVLTQWFERARFEYHPGNPEPYKVLLGLLGREVMPSASAFVPPLFDDRSGVAQAVLAYYNAVNRQEYRRAYGYWEQPGSGSPSTPPPYDAFVAGYANTASVAVTIGTPSFDAGAGNVWATVPVVLHATIKQGGVDMFAGCYVLHRTQPGIDPRPDAALWKLNRAAIDVAPAHSSPAALLPGVTCDGGSIPPP